MSYAQTLTQSPRPIPVHHSNTQPDFQNFPSLSTNSFANNNINNNNNVNNSNTNGSPSLVRLEQILLKQAEFQMKLAEDFRHMLNLLTMLVAKLG